MWNVISSIPDHCLSICFPFGDQWPVYLITSDLQCVMNNELLLMDFATLTAFSSSSCLL